LIKPIVTYFQRKRFPNGNFSVEFIFDDVRSRLAEKIEAKVAISSYHTQGIVKRILNIFEAYFRQSQVNHITGDIHYVGLLFHSKKTILTILDCGFMEGRGKTASFLLKLFWLYLPIKKAKFITAISEYTKNDILKYVDCNPEKIKVIPVAISTNFDLVAKEFNVHKPELLQIGGAPNKNLTRIIEAIKDMDIHLVIIGLLAETNRILLDKYHISYSNYVNLSSEQILERYISCDILLFPSTFEGFGMPILEAQAVGRPVITSNLCSMPEVGGDGVCLVDPFDVDSIKAGVSKVISDSIYRENLIEAGKQNVKRFHPDLIANMYFELYQAICKEK